MTNLKKKKKKRKGKKRWPLGNHSYRVKWHLSLRLSVRMTDISFVLFFFSPWCFYLFILNQSKTLLCSPTVEVTRKLCCWAGSEVDEWASTAPLVLQSSVEVCVCVCVGTCWIYNFIKKVLVLMTI